jgi:hypothetical protein
MPTHCTPDINAAIEAAIARDWDIFLAGWQHGERLAQSGEGPLFTPAAAEKGRLTRMRNMSFALTTKQVRNRVKTVTRRHGWTFLTPGDLVRAVVKSQGLKKGETVQPLGLLRVESVRREPLRRLLDDLDYGFAEVKREGFADVPLVQGSPIAFVEFYRNAQPASSRPSVDDDVTRIEFSYVDEVEKGRVA